MEQKDKKPPPRALSDNAGGWWQRCGNTACSRTTVNANGVCVICSGEWNPRKGG